MHHLGHAFLAVAPEAFRFGALIADGVRGEREKRLPPPIWAGIAFHREVDYRTDRHPAFQKARALLRPALGRYAGIFVDLWLDATLGENWSTFSQEPLSSFLENIRSAIQAYRHYGPPSWQVFFDAVVRTDLLARFATYEGMQAHLVTFLQRRRIPIEPVEAISTLARLHKELEPLLLDFWAEAHTWRQAYPTL